MRSLLKSLGSRPQKRRKVPRHGTEDTINQPSGNTDEPSEIFARSRDAFIASLSEEKRSNFATFQNAESMLQNFSQLAIDHPAKSTRLMACCQKLKVFASILSPYFEVVNILAQISPEYAGAAWGALRLIFVLGINYVSFLEKMSDMLEQMASTLPAFEEFLVALRKTPRSQNGLSLTRMHRVLGQLYHDLINFCYRACRLFSTTGYFSKAKVQLNLIWRPFDMYFSDTIEKFILHSKMLTFEMQSASSTQILNFYTEWEQRISREDEAIDQALVDKSVSALQQRIQSPAWATRFEHAREHRFADTGHWLLSDTTFKQHTDTTNQEANQQNILFVRAKPGYGKTTLATLAIEHLKSLTSGTCTQPLAFYFFDKQNSSANKSYDAYRALLSQLVYLRRYDEKVLDIAAVARRDHDTGQLFASDNEVYDILHLLLLHIGSCILICDEIDECSNKDDLFRGLSRIASDHKHCKLILFSRPSINLPLKFSHHCRFLDLENSKNREDLTKYVKPRIQSLFDAEYLVLPDDATLDTAVEAIVLKANGMFLWVTLFMDYLFLPFHSSSGRWKDMKDPSRFEGLHNLYDEIFHALQNNYPTAVRTKLRKALQWTCSAIRPLHVEELRIAIEIEPDDPLGPSNLIPKFAESLGPLSGSLLELTKDETVRLIHITLHDYLVSSAPKLSAFADNSGVSVHFTPEAMHSSIVVACLSYLKHSVPGGPYGTSNTTNVTSLLPTGVYRLMEYATKFWISHLLRMYEVLHNTPPTDKDDIDAYHYGGKYCLVFLTDKINFTSWTEAIWRLKYSQQMHKIIGDFVNGDLKSQVLAKSPIHQKHFIEITSLLRIVYQEQTYLRSSWRRVLETHPEEIWGPSISAFSRFQLDSPLHELSTAATMQSLTRIDPSEGQSIVIKTQVSSCGQKMALVTVKKPERNTRLWSESEPDQLFDQEISWDFDPDLRISRPPEGADDRSMIAVSYQIWSLDNNTRIFEKSMDIHQKSLVTALNNGDDSQGMSFLFPISITPTLHEAVLVDTFLKIFTSPGPTGISFHARVQRLSFPWIFQDSLLRPHRVPIQQSFADEVPGIDMPGDDTLIADLEDEDIKLPADDPHLIFPSSYELSLSPRGEFLLALRLGVDKGWSIDVFQDFAYAWRPGEPNFQWIAGRDLETRVGYNMDDSPGASFFSQGTIETAFHPFLPQVAYAIPSGTYLWEVHDVNSSSYQKARKSVSLIHSKPLKQMNFSPCGQLLYGFQNFDETGCNEGVIVNLGWQDQVIRSPYAEDESTSPHTSPLNTAMGILSKWTVTEQAPSIQTSNTSFIAADASGIPTLSTLQQSHSDNSLRLHTFNARGESRIETLLRLPQSIAHNGSITLLRPSKHTPGDIRIVLEAARQSYYTFDEEAKGLKLPAMIHRTLQSVPTVEAAHQVVILNDVKGFRHEIEEDLEDCHDNELAQSSLKSSPSSPNAVLKRTLGGLAGREISMSPRSSISSDWSCEAVLTRES